MLFTKEISESDSTFICKIFCSIAYFMSSVLFAQPENIILFGFIPALMLRNISPPETQSAPHPTSFKIDKIFIFFERRGDNRLNAL